MVQRYLRVNIVFNFQFELKTTFQSYLISLFSAGEDGLVKVWSRSGMLRSTVVRGNQPVLAAAWSPDNSSVLHSQGPFLLIQSLTTTSKPLKVNLFSKLF